MSLTATAKIAEIGPRKYSFIEPPPLAALPPLWFPPELRRTCVDSNISGVAAVGKYGLHKLRVLKEYWCQGVTLKPGDEIEVPGNSAFELISLRRAESLDPRRLREGELRAEAKRLAIPLDDSCNPAFDEEAIRRSRRRQ